MKYLQTRVRPLKIPAYSGVIIEKVASGYTVRGYSNTSAVSKTHKVIKQQRDPVITIGGIRRLK